MQWPAMLMTSLLLASLPNEVGSFSAQEFTAVKISGLSGTLHLRGSRAKSAVIKTKAMLGDAAPCALQARVDGRILTVVPKDKNKPSCRADIDITAPPHSDVALDLGEADVFVSGVRGQLSLKLSTGHAVLGGALTSLRVDIGAGSMSATGLLGHSEVKIESGNAQLWYDPAVTRGDVVLDVGKGNVVVGLPNIQLSNSVQLGRGSFDSTLPVTTTAPFALLGVMEAGNLSVRQLKR